MSICSCPSRGSSVGGYQWNALSAPGRPKQFSPKAARVEDAASSTAAAKYPHLRADEIAIETALRLAVALKMEIYTLTTAACLFVHRSYSRVDLTTRSSFTRKTPAPLPAAQKLELPLTLFG
ncbi:hypothetical protein H0A66_06020 [Alcaligenaceae bacterium]|nr:hypothetical protein [Alcaligenaceae bacterium]